MNQRTFFLKEKDCLNRDWYLVDAKNKVLGRLSSRIAKILQGKHKPTYTPHLLCGDSVVVINSKYIKLTGNKLKEKAYRKYTGYPGGLKEMSIARMNQKNPVKALKIAIKGMLPKTKLGKLMLKNLKLYPEEQHPHVAQNPKRIEV